jgi:hypothetical protein
MSNQNLFSKETWLRIERLVNGECNDEDVLDLEEFLRSNPTAQKLFLDYCQLHLDLSVEVRSEAVAHEVLDRIVSKCQSATSIASESSGQDSKQGEMSAGAKTDKPEGVSQPHPRSRNAIAFAGLNRSTGGFGGLASYMKHPVLLVIGGLLVLVGGLVGWSLPRDAQLPTAAIPKSEPRITPVAYLASANGCGWGEGSSRIPNVGTELQLGEEMTLYEGIAEFRLSSGVSLSVEGPATFIMTSSNSLFLQQGKLTAHVPWKAADFRLAAGPYPLTSRDAEFGVQVRGGNTKVHVFSGEVICASSPFSIAEKTKSAEADEIEAGGELSPTILVTQGKAIELSTNDLGSVTAKHLAADQNQFATKISMAGKLPITSRYVQMVKESRPVGYWRFESSENSEIRNEISSGCSLNLATDVSLQGDESNHVIELGHSYARGHLVSAQPLNALAEGDYSFEMWLKPSHYHRGFLVGMASRVPPETPLSQERQSGTTTRGRLENNSFTLGLQADVGPKSPGTLLTANCNPFGTFTHQCYSNELYALRRWQHVVVVKGESTMQTFLNGKVIGQCKGSKTMMKNMYLVVGRPFPSFNNYQYVGQLDELSVYDRALTAKEILKHYDAVEKARDILPST